MDIEKLFKASTAVIGIVGAAPIYASAWMVARIVSFPFPYSFYEMLDGFLYSEYQQYVALYFQVATGVKFIFHGDQPRLENILYLSNHQCTVDWFVVNMLAAPLSAIGRVKYILKDTLRFLPWYGWYFEQHGCIYVSKNWSVDQRCLAQAFNSIVRRKEKLWLVLFPEGTRFDATNQAAIQLNHSISTEKGLPLYHHHLIPRTKGFSGCMAGLRGHIDAVYDITVAYSTTPPPSPRPSAPSMADLMTSRYREVHVHVKRFDMDSFPMGEEALAEWIQQRFVAKDKLLEDYYAGTPWPGATWQSRPSRLASAARVVAWSAILAATFGTSLGRRLYLMQCLFGGLGGVAVMFAYRKWLRNKYAQLPQ